MKMLQQHDDGRFDRRNRTPAGAPADRTGEPARTPVGPAPARERTVDMTPADDRH